MKSKPLEKRMPVFNPNGADKQATKELIEALSTAAKDRFVGNYARDIIRSVKKGYEIQSGRRYGD